MKWTITRRALMVGSVATITATAGRPAMAWMEDDVFAAAKRGIVLADDERFELGWIVRERRPNFDRYIARTDGNVMELVRPRFAKCYSGTSVVRGCRALLVTREGGPQNDRHDWPVRIVDVMAHDDPRVIALREAAYRDAEREAVWRELRVEGSCRWRDLTSVRSTHVSLAVNRCDGLEAYRYADNGSRVWVRIGNSWDGPQPFAVSDSRPLGVAPETGPVRKSRYEQLREARAPSRWRRRVG